MKGADWWLKIWSLKAKTFMGSLLITKISSRLPCSEWRGAETSAGAALNLETETNYKRKSHAIAAKMSTIKIHPIVPPHFTLTAHAHRSSEMNQHLSTPITETTKRPTLSNNLLSQYSKSPTCMTSEAAKQSSKKRRKMVLELWTICLRARTGLLLTPSTIIAQQCRTVEAGSRWAEQRRAFTKNDFIDYYALISISIYLSVWLIDWLISIY